MSSLGDFHSGCTIYDLFVTTDVSGRPAALAGNPPIQLVVYRNAFVDSCSTAGATLSVNCNGLTGVHGWSVNTNQDKGFYACGSQYQVVLRGGCVDSICVSGYVVGRFSLNFGAALRPTIHGRNAVDVSTGGTVGVDWGNIDNKATAAALDCTTIFSVQSVLNAVTPTACSTIFSVQKVVDRVITDACSTIFSVQKVIDRPIIDACSTVYEVITISNSGVAKILDTSIVEPAGIFSWPGTLRNILAWLGAVASNQIKQEAGQQGVCDRAVSTTIAKATTTDDGTTATRGSFT